MKKKLLSINIIVIVMILMFFCVKNNVIASCSNFDLEKPAKVGVLLYKFNDEYISLLKNSLEEIQKENPNKVEFIFLDAYGNQEKQNNEIDKLLKEKVDLLLVNLVDTTEESTQKVVDRTKANNVPVIFFNRKPISKIPIKSYEKAVILSRIPEAGILQGKIVTDLWNNNKKMIDKNEDNIMQYVMLTGESNDLTAISRTENSIKVIKNSGIEVQELEKKNSKWDRELAKQNIASLLYQYGNKIEVIIANNDAMAIGAIEALQNQNYNKGDPNNTIIVVGVDATPKARELINQGYMAGTVFQDPKEEAEALYTLGMNLISGKNAVENTQYNYDESGVTVRLPYKEYIK
ncbi:galactose ABC transporter substrate-binding protein [Clostridium botulinum]|uniref:galactose ABC transporter substrate-binding protein n=1 Tax=Clostridium botulinum TaxID=1491 RepID=UPI0013F7DECE|nr:galactose ABC transporter substrate-binding protein [Clostridium botulinum]MBN1065298.1 galactose ABC transporter substrate-binding protein [Clostridium botulinum]NFO15271.1 galactose ABC transporter substrate-binding protein [Clostridium botulinum]